MLGRAVAVGHVLGAAAGLRETDRLRDVIGERHRWHAVRGHLLELGGDLPAAGTAYAAAAAGPRPRRARPPGPPGGPRAGRGARRSLRPGLSRRGQFGANGLFNVLGARARVNGGPGALGDRSRGRFPVTANPARRPTGRVNVSILGVDLGRGVVLPDVVLEPGATAEWIRVPAKTAQRLLVEVTRLVADLPRDSGRDVVWQSGANELLVFTDRVTLDVTPGLVTVGVPGLVRPAPRAGRGRRCPSRSAPPSRSGGCSCPPSRRRRDPTSSPPSGPTR